MQPACLHTFWTSRPLPLCNFVYLCPCTSIFSEFIPLYIHITAHLDLQMHTIVCLHNVQTSGPHPYQSQTHPTIPLIQLPFIQLVLICSSLILLSIYARSLHLVWESYNTSDLKISAQPHLDIPLIQDNWFYTCPISSLLCFPITSTHLYTYLFWLLICYVSFLILLPLLYRLIVAFDCTL